MGRCAGAGSRTAREGQGLAVAATRPPPGEMYVYYTSYLTALPAMPLAAGRAPFCCPQALHGCPSIYCGALNSFVVRIETSETLHHQEQPVPGVQRPT